MARPAHSTRDPRTAARHLDELAAIVRRIGSPVWVAGDTLAALYGVDGYTLTPPFNFAVPRRRAPHAQGHLVHRLRDVSRLDQAMVLGLPALSATRLLIESAGSKDARQLTLLLDCLLRDGMTSEQFLHRRIVELRRRGRPGLDHLLGVIEGTERTRGGHSFLEREYLAYLADVGLPAPDTQQVLARRGTTLVRVDCRFPGTNVIVELLGYRWHRTKEQMQTDAARVNVLQLAGFDVYQFTYDDVTMRSSHLCTTMAELTPRLRP
jgi:hypothetical protein